MQKSRSTNSIRVPVPIHAYTKHIRVQDQPLARPPGEHHQQAGQAVRPADQPGHRLAVYRLHREERPGQQGGGAGEVEAVPGGGVEQHHSHGVDGDVSQMEHRSAQPEQGNRPPGERYSYSTIYSSVQFQGTCKCQLSFTLIL